MMQLLIQITIIFYLLIANTLCQEQLSEFQQCKYQLSYISRNQYEPYSQVCNWSSSKAVNNLGDMDRCINTTDTNFISIYFNKPTGNINPIPLELCLPGVCTQQIIQDNIEYFNYYLNTKMSRIFDEQIIEITNVYDGINNGPRVSIGVIISIIIFATIILLSIMGSIIVYKYDLSKEKRIQSTISEQKQEIDNSSHSTADSDNSDSEQTQINQQNNLVKFGSAFDLIGNFSKVFSLKSAVNQDLSFYNGTRFFLITWIILGQSYLIRYGSIKNVVDKEIIESTAGYSTIAVTSQLAVDMFFYISGFFLAVSTLEKFYKKIEVKIQDVFKFIGHRLIRLLPIYFIVIIFYWKIWQFSGNGPMWNQYQDKIDACDSKIWSNLLLINNLTNNGDSKGCFEWGFVIANEIQFFIIGIFLLYIYQRKRNVGFCLIFAVFINSSFATFIISFIKKYNAHTFTVSNPSSFYNDFHIKPWTKMGIYFLGVMCGIFYHSYRSGNPLINRFSLLIQKNILVRYFVQIIGLCFMSLMIECIIPVQQNSSYWSQGHHSFYLSFGKIIFAFGYFLLTIPSLLGVKNILWGMLGSKIWTPLSKISFCMYLVHQLIIERSLFDQRSLRYFTDQYALFAFLPDILFIFFLGSTFCFLIEVPFKRLEKLFLKQTQNLNVVKFEKEESETIDFKKQAVNV